MSAPGKPLENAVMERFVGTLKSEEVEGAGYERLGEVSAGVGAFIRQYNEARLHSTLGYLPPAEYEERHKAANGLALPVSE